MSWNRIARKTLYDSRFLKLYSDTVELPDGKVVDDYSVVKIPDGVSIIATDAQGRLILIEEYKYALGETILTVPAGGIEKGEDPLVAARRELTQETGYEADEAELLAILTPYPSKIIHGSYVVRLKGCTRVGGIDHEDTETISAPILVRPEELSELQKSGKFKTTYMQAALALAFAKYL